MTPRHALYWVPALGDPLWRAGCAWLGRDPAARRVPSPAPAHRAAPWRYGFHATVKAPLVLRDGVDESDWAEALAALALRHGDACLPRLQLVWLHDFLALAPIGPVPSALAALIAFACFVIVAVAAFRRDASGLAFYHVDRLGSTVAMTSTTGTS